MRSLIILNFEDFARTILNLGMANIFEYQNNYITYGSCLIITFNQLRKIDACSHLIWSIASFCIGVYLKLFP